MKDKKNKQFDIFIICSDVCAIIFAFLTVLVMEFNTFGKILMMICALVNISTLIIEACYIMKH